MPLPKKISPTPVVSATVEIRFKSELTPETTLGYFFKLYSDRFPKQREITKAEVNDNVVFQKEYSFANENHAISFSSHSIAITVTNQYSSWESLFKEVTESLAILSDQPEIKELQRIGVRFINIFQNQQSLNKVTSYFQSDIKGYSSNLQLVKSTYEKDNLTLYLQSASKAKGEMGEGDKKIIFEGVYIDIDASVTTEIPKSINEDLFTLIDRMHLEIKSLLFDNVLNKEFIKTLKIEY